MVSQRYYKTQTGFSLIEILISLLVLSIGLLGLGGLQLSSLKSANNAHLRTVASLAVTDLADRMRVNSLGVAKDFYAASLGFSHCETPLTKVCEANNPCSAKELAVYDLYRVNCGVSVDENQTGGVQFDLPEATLSVSCSVPPCATGVEHSIMISWNETDDDDGDSDVQERSYELSFIP